jgi:hypothetical protein
MPYKHITSLESDVALNTDEANSGNGSMVGRLMTTIRVEQNSVITLRCVARDDLVRRSEFRGPISYNLRGGRGGDGERLVGIRTGLSRSQDGLLVAESCLCSYMCNLFFYNI